MKKRKPADFNNYEERPAPFTGTELALIYITIFLLTVALKQIF